MRYHRFDFPDLPIDAFKHYGDRRIKPQGGGGGGFVGEFIGNPLGATVDAASNIINGASDVLHEVTAPILDPISDVIHDVGTTVAKSPILNTAAFAVMVANGVPPTVASALVSANAGASPETIARNMVLAGVGSEIASQVAPEISKLSESQLFGQAAGQAAGSAASAAVAGKDPLAAALTSFVSSGANVATGEIVKDIPGFDNLPKTAQDSVRSAVNAALQGKDPTMAAVNRAMNAGVQEAVKYGTNIFNGSVTNIDQADFGVNQGAIDRVAMNESGFNGIDNEGADLTGSTYNPPNYAPQDLGITQENIDSYEKTQQENAAAGGWPSGYKANEDGTATMVHNDGSTTTIDDKNDIVYTTEAPPGSLISDPTTDETFTKLSPAKKSTALDMVKSGIPLSQAVNYVNGMGQTVQQPAQQTQQTTSSGGTTLSPLNAQYLTSKAGSTGFVNPLSVYQQMVAKDVQAPPAQTTQAVQQTQENAMPNYYNYGSNQSIDDIFGFGSQFTAKEGGMVTPLMASGGSVQKYAEGGLSVPMMSHGGKLRGDFRQGAHVAGPGDGQSDDIPAMLADGEFVFPADVVSALGNGSTKAGSQKLYDMMHSIRDRARSKGSKDLPPPALKSPLDYLSKKSRS